MRSSIDPYVADCVSQQLSPQRPGFDHVVPYPLRERPPTPSKYMTLLHAASPRCPSTFADATLRCSRTAAHSRADRSPPLQEGTSTPHATAATSSLLAEVLSRGTSNASDDVQARSVSECSTLLHEGLLRHLTYRGHPTFPERLRRTGSNPHLISPIWIYCGNSMSGRPRKWCLRESKSFCSMRR